MTSQHEVLPLVYLNISSDRYRYSGTIDPEKEKECVTKVHTQSTGPHCPISMHNILLLEIQLLGGGCDQIIRLTPVTYMCRSPPKSWISNAICRGLF